MLMKEAFRWAPGAGISRFELSVMVTNTRAIAFYERVGFKFEGLRRRAYMVNGVPVDDHVMGYVFEA
jgi:RimJ/RimL family protein N-acetyltransferase